MFIRRLKDCAKPEDPARIVFLVTAWFAAYYFVLCRFAFNSVHHQATPAMLVSGTAYKPFQYRALVGWVVGLFSSTFPGIPLPTWFRLAELFSVFFLLVAYRSYIALFIKDEILNSLLSFFMLYVLFFNYLLYPNYPVWFPWDMPSVLFFTLGLTLIYRRKWALYYPLFILATFNRETSCFLTIVYLLTAIKKDPAGTVALHFSAQLLIWVAVKSFLFLLYAGNPGWELFEGQMRYNAHLLSRPEYYPFILCVFGFVWVPVVFLFGLIREEFVRRSLLVVFPFFLVMFFTARMVELRVYGELIPVVLTAFLLVVKESFAKASAAAEQQ